VTTRRPEGRVIDVDDSIQGTNVMAEQLTEISAAVRQLLNGRLKEEAIIILIREQLPHGMKLSPREVRSVLHAARDLANAYVKRE
jgi:hypothetical protein